MLTKGAFLCLALVGVSCGKQPLASPETQARSFVSTPSPLVRREWGEARFKVCALLSQQEVAEVQQEQIKETKSAGGSDDSLFISQCFYLTPEMQLSVEMSVIEKDASSNGNRTPQTLWDQMFRSDPARTESGEEEAERKKRPASQAVSDIGYESYWVTGALYVLKADRILRIAVSGQGTPESKLAKAKSLAQKAVSRM
jgi:hypothetical protein